MRHAQGWTGARAPPRRHGTDRQAGAAAPADTAWIERGVVAMFDSPAPTWIVPGRAYPGWGWVVAAAALWALFALLLLVIGELQRGLDAGRVTATALGYYGTALAALFVSACAFVRRRWARQLALVTAAPMLLFIPVGTVVALGAMRALWRAESFFDSARS